MSATMHPKTPEVFNYLKECASKMRVVTYGEVEAAVGEHALSLGPRHLDYIQDEICRPRGLPFISAIVVNSRTWKPGTGFMPDGVTINEHDLDLFWRGVVLQVFATDWSKVEIDS